ncbi:MAG: cysteine desulfurase [Proteobacteria bacterium]|jgi:cysteine desulfurase|nr:cysteine desulfurase [Pseudomonadota bacterium]
MSFELTYVYLDHNATTPLSQEVEQAVIQALPLWGNPSSIHQAGRGPKSLLREARKNLARELQCSPLELIFTSGGSESNNSVIKGVYEKTLGTARCEFITSTVEHPSVLKSFQYLESLGARVYYVPVSRQGILDIDYYERVLSEKTALVSIMAANNETGVLFPVSLLSQKAHEKGALFHTDAVQAFGKIPVSLKDWNVDFASFSGHKFYSLKGTGLLYAKKSSEMEIFILGGAQERARRGGTENVLGIHALGIQANQLKNVGVYFGQMEKLRNRFEERLLESIPGVKINQAQVPRLPNTSSVLIEGVDGETLLMSLDIKGFAVSTGAACSSGNPEPSPVLLAMGLTAAEAQNSLRVSLGWSTTEEQMDHFLETLKSVVQRLRRLAESDVGITYGS